MGKRSNFERVERDFYPTPYEAVVPLLSHLGVSKRGNNRYGCVFSEPCAGDGALIHHLTEAGHMVCFAGDIEPRSTRIVRSDALQCGISESADCFITNPPWDRKILHPLIVHLSDMAPTWLLFDADWMHTKQSAEFMPRCKKIVSVGRVKWIPDSKMTGKDNCAWYLFDSNHSGPTEFYGRVANG